MRVGGFSVLSVCLMTVSAAVVLADVGHKVPKPPFFFGSYELEITVALFLVNLLLNACILLIPCLVLFYLDFEERISANWIWAIPMLSAVGAYIDVAVFYHDAIPQVVGLILVALSFFVVAVIYLGLRLSTGLIVCTLAFFLNLYSWSSIEWSRSALVFLMVIGTIYVILLVFLFVRNTHSYVTRDPGLRRRDYPGQVVAFVITFGLILYALIYI